MKTVYIAHPLRGNIQDNIKKITTICQQLPADVNPVSPIHNYSHMSADGDQSRVLSYCLDLLSRCDELWVHGDWRNSEGCQMEIEFARDNGIPIRFIDQEAGK